MRPSNDNDTIFSVDDTSDLPIWVQLRNRIAYLIRTGHFGPGEQLPSVRSLSTSAKINYNTVTKAYKDLEQSSLIVSIRGRGMYVQKNVAANQESAEEAIDLIVEDCVRQYRSTGMTFEDARARMQDIASRLEEAALGAAEEKREYYDA
ncbi:MAG: GntR family transcriptional regulator [Coriobacteriales bacterium]|nr:GntR family transcriptional regulator [Coriobacteriales bacterium]